MRSRSALFFVLAEIGFATLIHAQNATTFLNPGIKLGYTFGDNGGFTYGAEISYVWMIRPEHSSGAGASIGPVLDIDFLPRMSRIHLGIETAYAVGGLVAVGVCGGPTILFKDGDDYWGYSVIPFIGALMYPYFNYTSVGELRSTEVGGYLKYHLHTGAGTFNLVR